MINVKRLILPLTVVALVGVFLPSGGRRAYASCPSITPLADEVAEANVIVMGTVSEMIIRPPLDPSAPDEVLHTSHFLLAVDEYRKGAGPDTLEIFEPGLAFSFTETGEVLTQVSSAVFFTEESVGKRYLLFLRGTVDSLRSPGCSNSRALGFLPSDQELLDQIRDLLSLTPTSTPAATPTPAALPAQLPPTGGDPVTNSGAPWSPLAITFAGSLASAVLAATAYLLRHRIARHD